MVIVGNHPQLRIPLLRVLCALCVEIPIPPPSSTSQEISRSAANSRRICTYTKPARNPFTIRTSKTRDLKPFRICTYEKNQVGDPLNSSFSQRQKRLYNIQVLRL